MDDSNRTGFRKTIALVNEFLEIGWLDQMTGCSLLMKPAIR
jgi:hypothetical protein